MRLRLERRIAYLQNILNVRYPVELVSTVQVSPSVEPPPVFFETVLIPDIVPSIIELPLEIEQLDDGFTDILEEELQQRDAEQKQLQDALTQLELDRLMKRKPRVKK